MKQKIKILFVIFHKLDKILWHRHSQNKFLNIMQTKSKITYVRKIQCKILSKKEK